MFKKTKLRFGIYGALIVILCAGLWVYVSMKIPNDYYSFKGEEIVLESFPVTATPHSETDNYYELDVKLMGLIPIKTVKVRVMEDTMVIPGGEAFGVKYYADGVMVVGMSDVETQSGSSNPAFDAGLRTSDIIQTINGETIHSNEELSDIINKNGSAPITIEAVRRSLQFSVTVTPQLEASSGQYKIGIWVRDSTAGIGTITYYDPINDTFAGLGHSISDVDTLEILPLSVADVIGVSLTGIRKGEVGLPGELKGMFDSSVKIGSLYKNVDEGVFGYLEEAFDYPRDPMNIAFKQDVKEGKATIIASIDNEGPKEYEVEIIDVNHTGTQTTKNMIVKVTDPQLLEKTGGIVQGMSGSPIIQDGKLIGAVTHVFVNDPTRGYGIFIENMLESSENIAE